MIHVPSSHFKPSPDAAREAFVRARRWSRSRRAGRRAEPPIELVAHLDPTGLVYVVDLPADAFGCWSSRPRW